MDVAVQPGPSFPIPPTILPQVAPSTYVLSHLLSPSPIRPGGRSPSQTRHISLHTGSLTNTNGSALVRLGNTTVLCGVRAEVLDVRNIANYRPDSTGRSTTASEPRDDSELARYGLLVPNIELQTGASPLSAFQPSSGAPSTLAQSLTQRLLSAVYATRLVRADDLRIYGADPTTTLENPDEAPQPDQGQLLKGYWTLYIDALILSHDGSLFDASFMALSAALRDTRLPKAWFDADREQIVCSSRTESFSALKLGGESPISLSWRVFVDNEEYAKRSGDRRWILLDPDALEEESGACPESGTMMVDRSNEASAANGHSAEAGGIRILKIEKSGGGMLRPEDLEQIGRIAEDRWEEWQGVLKDSAIR